MKYTDIFIKSTKEHAQQLTQQVFQQNGFNIKWSSPDAGKATKGSKGKNIAFGALSQYYEIDFQIMKLQDDKIAVRLFQSTSGWVGGALGAHKVKKKYKEIVDMLTNWFKHQGAFVARKP
jgi:hypothetical protein